MKTIALWLVKSFYMFLQVFLLRFYFVLLVFNELKGGHSTVNSLLFAGSLPKYLQQPGLDHSQELGTQPASPMWVTGTSVLEISFLALTPDGSWAELGLKPRQSDLGYLSQLVFCHS